MRKSTMKLNKETAAKEKAEDTLKRITVRQHDKYICMYCGTEYKDINNYPVTRSEFYKAYATLEKDGRVKYHLPFCKNCLNKIWETQLTKYLGNEKKAIKRLCAIFDMPYDERLFESTGNGKFAQNSRLNSWIRQSNMVQWARPNPKVGYLPNFETYFLKLIDEEITTKTSDGRDVPPEIIKRFGAGFTPEQYLELQEIYDSWKYEYGDDTNAKRTLFIRVACTLIAINKAQQEGGSTKDLDKQLQDLMDKLNVLPKQNKLEAEAMSNKYTLGELIANFEQEEPIIDVDEEFQDVDGIGRYIDVFFKGGLANGMGLKGNFFSTIYHKVMDGLTAKPSEQEKDTVNKELYHRIFGEDDI